MLFTKEIAALKLQVTGLTDQVATLTEEKTTLISEHADAIKAKDERILALENEAKETKAGEEKRVETAVVTQIADAGAVPIQRVPAADAKEMNRAEFAALRPQDQSAFCRSGGKIID